MFRNPKDSDEEDLRTNYPLTPADVNDEYPSLRRWFIASTTLIGIFALAGFVLGIVGVALVSNILNNNPEIYGLQQGIVSAVTAKGSTFSISYGAQEVSPGTFYLGKKMHKNGKMVDSFAHVTRASKTHPFHHNKRQLLEVDAVTCSAAIGDGFVWKTSTNVLLDPSNDEGISQQLIMNTYRSCRTKWNTISSFQLTSSVVATDLSGANLNNADGINEVVFGDIQSTYGSDLVAVTIIYGDFNVPQDERQILEVDQIFDTAYTFGNAQTNPNDFDMESTITHELGHRYTFLLIILHITGLV